MPREAQELVRQGGFKDAEKFFILSFEGTVTEKRYFESLRASSLFNDCGLIETIPLSRKKTAALGSNPNVVKSLLKSAKDDFNFRSTDEFWLIIDRDQWESIHHIDLSKLVEDCKNEDNFFIAMSNPCFEIWLIFHHTDLTRYSEDELDKIKENVKISNKKHHIDTVLEELIGHAYNKRPKAEDFIPHTYSAIRTAAKYHTEGEDLPTNIGSDVYILVQKLIK